jgi:hypothetical protein
MGFAAIPNSKFDSPVTFTPREVYNKVFAHIGKQVKFSFIKMVCFATIRLLVRFFNWLHLLTQMSVEIY